MKKLKYILIGGIVGLTLSLAFNVYSVTLLRVPQGGTGAGSFTSNAVLKGDGTGPLTSSGVIIDGSNVVTGITSLYVDGNDSGGLFNITNIYNGTSVPLGSFDGVKTGSAVADNDEALLEFRLKDDSGTTELFGRMTWVGTDINVGTGLDSAFDFSVLTAGTLAKELRLTGTALSPFSDGGLALGTTTTSYNGLNLNTGTAIDWEAGDILLTHSVDLLALTGGGFTVSNNITGGGNAIFTNKVWANAGTEIVSNEASYIVSTDADTGEYTDIQTAMDVACVTAGAVFIKAGTYTLTSTLAVGCSDLTVYGEGESTIIQFNGSSVTNAFANSGTTQRSRLRIGNMKIISTSSGNGTGIEMNYWRKSLFEKLHIVDVNICVHGGGSGVFYNTVQNVQCEPEGTGNIGFKFDLEGNDNRLIDTQVISASGLTTTGYYIDAGGIWITGADVDSALIGIDIQDGGNNTSVMNSWLEANDVAIDTDTDVETVTIISNHLSSSVSTDISGGGRGIFVQSHSDGDPLLFYGYENVRFGLGTSSPDYSLDIEDSSVIAMLRINGSGSNFVQSAIRLDSDNTNRGNGIYTYDATSLEEWYFGNPYLGNDAFVINRRANAATFNLDAADEDDADVQNFFQIDSVGLVTLGTMTTTGNVTSGDSIIATKKVRANSGDEILSNQATYIVSTDSDTGDYTDIQSAINNLPSSGGTIFVKQGTYTLTSGITIADSDVAVIGEGRNTIIAFNSATVSTALSDSGTTQRTNLEFKNFLISQTGTAGTGTCINMTYFATSVFENVDCLGANTGYSAGQTGTHYNTIISPTISVSGSNSAGVTLSNNAIFNTLINPRILTDTDSVGIYIDAHAFRCISCNVETNALIGLNVGPLGNDAELDVYLEGNQTNLQLASGVEAIRVTGFIADADVAAQNIVDNGAKSLSVEARVQYDPSFYISSNGNTNDIFTLVNNQSSTTTYFNLEGTGAFAGSSPAITWENSAGSLNTARIRSAPGASYVNSTFSIDVADSSKVLQERFEIDVNGLVTLGTMTTSGSVTVGGAAIFQSTVRLKGYTVATLPSGIQGDTAFVTDALGPTFLAPVVGGGAVVTTVFYDGTNWVVD